MREKIVEALEIVNADIDVPTDLTRKIVWNEDDNNTNNNNSNTKNNDNKKSDNKLPTIDTNSNDSNKNDSNEDKKQKMALLATDYYNMCIRQLNTIYTGDPLGLPPFISSIKLLQSMDKESTHREILKGVLLTKLQGKAREAIQENATIEEIIANLKKYIKSDSSEVVQGKLMALRADRNSLTDFAGKAESLAEQFKRALRLENIPNENADKMTTKAITELCRANTQSTVIDTLMAGEQFATAKDAIAKYIVETRKESGKQQVLFFRNYNQRGRGYNYNQNSYAYRNNKPNYRQNTGNFRGGNNNRRGGHANNSYRNNRSRGHNNYNRGNSGQNTSRPHRHIRIISEENGEAPASQRGQAATETQN